MAQAWPPRLQKYDGGGAQGPYNSAVRKRPAGVVAHSASPSDLSHPSPGETPSLTGVSFVVPGHNGARWLDEVLAAILTQAHGGPVAVLAVDDGRAGASP